MAGEGGSARAEAPIGIDWASIFVGKRFREFSVERRPPTKTPMKWKQVDSSKSVWKMTDVKDTGLEGSKIRRNNNNERRKRKRGDFARPATETNESDWSTLPPLLLHHLFPSRSYYIHRFCLHPASVYARFWLTPNTYFIPLFRCLFSGQDNLINGFRLDGLAQRRRLSTHKQTRENSALVLIE